MARFMRDCGLFACVLAVAVFVCGAARSNPITVRNAAGDRVTIRDNTRIVSIGGAITEILYALGVEDRIVAIDSTSVYPLAALRDKPNVGYMRALSAEGVLGLNPSLILALEGSGPPATLAVLRASQVPLLMVPDHFTGKGIVEKIELIATAAGAAGRGECLARAVMNDLTALSEGRAQVKQETRVAFLLSFVNDRAMVAGRATAADAVIRLAGAINAIDAFEGYKQVSDEAVIAAQPQFVLAMQRDSYPLDAATVFSHTGFGLTPAAKSRAFLTMDGLYLLGFGPRTALAARDLAATLYPAVPNVALPSEQNAGRHGACRQ